MTEWNQKFDLLFAGPTFDALVANRGKMDTSSLQRKLQWRLKSVLSDRDLEPYRMGGNSTRWWNDLRAQAEKRRECGSLERSISRGVWKITAEGAAELEFNRSRFQKSGLIVPQDAGWELTEKGQRWWKLERVR